MLTRRIRIPYSVGLVTAGIVLATLPFAPRIELTRELVLTGLLPPLLFEAALYLNWEELWRDFSVISLLATIGVALSAFVTAIGMNRFAQWPWPSALIFGVLIAATDPVSVIATFKEAKARGRLLLLIESESLLNDGTAAVGFGVALALAGGHTTGAAEIIWLLVKATGGGILCGVVVALGALLLAGRTDDRMVEITLTTTAAYGSFLLADNLGVSGVLATITAGLTIGNFRPSGRFRILNMFSEQCRESVQAFWDYAAFVANSLVFLLIGMRTVRQNFASLWQSAVIAILLVALGRAVAIYPCCALFARSRLAVSMKHQHVLFWGGLRGALALALALGLPADIPRREEIVTVSFAVVAFSIFVQGLTIPPFLRKSGEIPALPR